MPKKTHIAVMATLSLLLASCATRYRLTGVERTRILIDSRYDAAIDPTATTYLAPYKAHVDSLMSPVVGHVAHDMAARKPESDLSNLLADILLWSGQRFGERPDFAVYNMGGIRAALSKGVVTKGDVLDVAPFENHICFLTLTGASVRRLFEQIAATGGQGLSSGANLTITRDGKLAAALVGGQPIDTDRQYRIATLDYLAQGNDGLEAFKDKTDTVTPEGEGCNARDIIEDYFRKAMAEGHAVDSRVEGRIVVE